MGSPKISIITVCYNAGCAIEKTILSVINQIYSDKEYIIIDGYSNDGTINLIKKYTDIVDVFISEPDKGIYDAMNKGIKIASGEYIIFMNAGDSFYNDYVLRDIFGKMEDRPAVVFGDVAFYSEGKLFIQKATPFYENLPLHHSMGFNHQSSFVQTKIAKKLLFNLSYKYAADYDMMIRIFRQGGEFKQVAAVIAIYDIMGISEKKRIPHIFETINIDNPHSKVNFLVAAWEIIKYKFRKITKSLCLKLYPAAYTYLKIKSGNFSVIDDM